MKRNITMRLYLALLLKPGSYVWGRRAGLRGEHSSHRTNCRTSLQELSQLNHAFRKVTD